MTGRQQLPGFLSAPMVSWLLFFRLNHFTFHFHSSFDNFYSLQPKGKYFGHVVHQKYTKIAIRSVDVLPVPVHLQDTCFLVHCGKYFSALASADLVEHKP